MTRAPNSLLDFSTSSAVENASAFEALPSITSAAASQQYYLSEVALTNTSATTTLVRILGGSDVKYNVPAPASSGAFIRFEPPLPIGFSNSLRLQAAEAAEIEISLRAFKGL
jgi:hypothetical protein